MTRILAVDPGLTKPGVALLVDGVLVGAARVRGLPRSWLKLGILERCNCIAEAIVGWSAKTSRYEVIDALVAEWPKWYPNGKSIDPNDLAGLCGISGAVAAKIAAKYPELKISSPFPSEVWGNLPKSTTGDPWDSPRGRRLAARLTPTERAVVEPYHDALDAAGLALWGAGRWQDRKRVFPGAVKS